MLELALSGTPKAMGLAHGESFRTQIQEFCALRRQLLMDYFLVNAKAKMQAVLQKQIQKLDTAPNLREELQCIAQGAQVSLEALMILNDFTDLRDYSWVQNAGEVEGCSTFFMSSELDKIYGQSWDMHASAQDYLCHVTINNKPKIELLSLVGCLGIMGRNEYGLSVFVNNLRCTQVSPGLMWSAVVRLMLQEKNVNSAIKVLSSNLPSSGRNYLIVDKNSAVNVETTGEHLEVLGNSFTDSVLFHTNHYLGKLKQYGYIDDPNPTTYWRYEKLEKYFNNLPDNLTAEQLAQSLLIKKSLNSVYVPGDGSFECFKTCGGLIVDKRNSQMTLFQDEYGTGFSKTLLIS